MGRTSIATPKAATTSPRRLMPSQPPLPGLMPVNRVVVEFLIDADQTTVFVGVSSHYADGSLNTTTWLQANDSPARAAQTALAAALELLEEHVHPF